MEIQRKLEILGDNACYLLCLIKAAGADTNDIIKYYDMFLEKRLLEEDVFINDPVGILKYLGVPVNNVEKSSTLKSGKIVIARYKYMSHLHFVLIDQYGNIVFDPLGNSNTVRYGKIESYRIFR